MCRNPAAEKKLRPDSHIPVESDDAEIVYQNDPRLRKS
jgi:hypothetical protein